MRATRIRGERPAEPRRDPLPPPEPVADPARPRAIVDYALQRRALLTELAAAGPLSPQWADAREADPYLLRAARHHGERTERPCPLCRTDGLVHVTYAFGDELGYRSGRVVGSEALPDMAREHGQFRVYVVEVCQGCGWNHLHLSYALGDGVPRRPPPTPRDLLD